MRYWPLSVIAQNPSLHHAHTWELMRAYHTPVLSEGTMMACNHVAAHTKPCNTPLVIIQSIGAPMRRMYTEPPLLDDWLRLERAGFTATDDHFVFVIDALH